MTFFNRQYFKKTNLWIPPFVGVLVAIILSSSALYIDTRIEWKDPPGLFFSGSSDTARSLLSVIAGSVTTLLALIFTIIVVAVQLASSQYSPRTLSSLLQDKPSHFTIGVFVCTFTYTLIVLLMLRLTEKSDGEDVTGLSLTLAFGMAVISLATFAVFSSHIIHAVRVTSLINRIGSETRETIHKLYCETGVFEKSFPVLPKGEPDHTLYAKSPGVIVEINDQALLDIAEERGCTIVINPIVGAFVPEGFPLLMIYGEKDERLLRHVKVMSERTSERNALFGLRQLSDMAVRANSTGINDPASCVQVLDQIHDLLRRLLKRPMDDLYLMGTKGELRLYMPLPSWDDVLHVAVEDVRLNGSTSLQVVRRLRAALKDLLNVAPESRKGSIRLQLDLLDEQVKKNFSDNEHVFNLAMQSDLRGMGF